MPFAKPFGVLPEDFALRCPFAAINSVMTHRVAAIMSQTTCLVGDISRTKDPIWIGSHCGSSTWQANPGSKHGNSSARESVICGVMISSPPLALSNIYLSVKGFCGAEPREFSKKGSINIVTKNTATSDRSAGVRGKPSAGAMPSA